MSPTRHQAPARPGVFKIIFSASPAHWLLSGILGLALLLAGCGATSSGGSGGTGIASGKPTATATSRPTGGRGMTMRPCPGPQGTADQTGRPDLVLTPSTPQRQGSVVAGGLVQVQLPSTQQWTLTGASGIEVLQPTGIQDISTCVWNFRATQAGTATMSFTGRPLCEPPTPCPQYILAETFTVKVG